MIRTLLTRITTGTLGLTLLALAATGASHAAHADGPVITPTTNPTTIGLPPAKPDLVVKFDFVTCTWDPMTASPFMEIKTRVINMTNTPAMVNFFTSVKVDGAEVPGSPHTMLAPLWTTEVFHL